MSNPDPILDIVPNQKPSTPNIAALYNTPAFWRGVLHTREEMSGVAAAMRVRKIIAHLEGGASIEDSPDFRDWLAHN